MNDRKVFNSIDCFIKRDDKYLMLKRAESKKFLPGVWLGIGGKREIGEGLIEATRREVKEETGLEIKNIKVLCAGNAYYLDTKEELFYHFLIADYDGGEIAENPEEGEFKWLTLEEILKLDNLLAECKEILPLIFKKNPKFISFKSVYKTANILDSLEIENPS